MRWVLTLLCLVLTSSVAISAESDSATTTRANSLKPGKWALQFAIIGDVFHLDEFAGGISLKRQFSDKSAFRLGLDVAAGRSEDLGEPSERERSNYHTVVSLVYQRYVNPGADANLYWCAGPTVAWDRNRYEAEGDSTQRLDQRTETEVGIVAALGIEWFATHNISFHGEYLAEAVFLRTTNETTIHRIGFPSQRGSFTIDHWNIETNGVRFGLSVYY